MNKVYEEALPRIPKIKEKVLLRLTSFGISTNVELAKISIRFGDSIFRLRREGYVIKREFVGKGIYTYELMGKYYPKYEPEAIDKFVFHYLNVLGRFQLTKDAVEEALKLSRTNIVNKPKY